MPSSGAAGSLHTMVWHPFTASAEGIFKAQGFILTLSYESFWVIRLLENL